MKKIILINRYAESYNILLQENFSLKEEIKDLKENLNLNKDIISSMFKDMKDKKKISYSNILQKLSQENVAIYKQIEKISSERNKLRNELIQIKEEKLCGQEQLAQENNKLKTKLFLMEQNLIKVKSLYELTKKKQDKRNSKIAIKNNNNVEKNQTRSRSQTSSSHNKNLKKNFTNPTNPNDRSNFNMSINKKFFGNIIEKKKFDSIEESNEVYIVDPSKAVVKLNDELIFYKESHQKFLTKLKKKQETIEKYENMINKLNAENNQLRKTYKMKLMKVNNEKENILTMIVQNNINLEEQANLNTGNNNILNKNKKNSILGNPKMSSGLSVTTTDNNDYNVVNTFEQLNIDNNQLKKIINKDEVIGKETTLEEFGAVLKSVGLTRELFEKMSQIKGFGKLTDSIEFFYKLTLEKNKQILILEKENESLIFKNYELNKINIELENELKLYKNNPDNIDKNLNINNVKKILDDDSIVDNHSQNTNMNMISKLNTNVTSNTNNTINTNNNNQENNLHINSTVGTLNNNINGPLLNYKKLIEKQKEEGQLKKAEMIFNLSLEKENESSSCSKNNNNNGELAENDNYNDDNGNEEDERNENEENEENEDNEDNDNNDQLYLDSNSYGIQFKDSYTENTNSKIDSIMSKDFNSKYTEESQD